MSIGIENESSLHHLLKLKYAGKNGETEARVEDFICDVKTESGEIIEVQTSSFAPLKKKIKALSKKYKVRIIHPIVVQKHIILYGEDGTLIRKRKSPKKENVWNLFDSLVHAPEIVFCRNVKIELVFVDILERRVDNGAGSWRRRGVSIDDKICSALHGIVPLSRKKDYELFIPFKKNEDFTAACLADKAGIDRALARKCVYTLCKAGFIKQTGKKQRAHLYRLK